MEQGSIDGQSIAVAYKLRKDLQRMLNTGQPVRSFSTDSGRIRLREPQATLAQPFLVRNWDVGKRAKALETFASVRQSNRNDEMTTQLVPE